MYYNSTFHQKSHGCISAQPGDCWWLFCNVDCTEEASVLRGVQLQPTAVCEGIKWNREMWKSRDYAPFLETASHQFPMILVVLLGFNTIHPYSCIWQIPCSYSITETWASHLPGGSFYFLFNTLHTRQRKCAEAK